MLELEGLSSEQVRRAFALTHNGYLTLNDEIAKRSACFGLWLPNWRAARDRWVKFYSQGWSSRRYDEMLRFRGELWRWRKLLFQTCEVAERDVPLYALR